MLAGLQSAAPVVRERAAYCLGRLIGQVPGQQLGAIVNALGAAARQETSGTVLEAMYRALDIPAQAPAAFQAIVTALTERIPKYAAGDVRFARAETAAGVVLQHLVAAAGRQSIPQATLQDAVPPLARLLKLATLSFLAGPTPLMTERQRAVRQADLAGCVATIEGALGVVVHAVKTDVTLPSITSKLTQSAEAVATEVQLELNRWIGTADTPGVLNQAPFNLPAALPDTKLAPTATNPAPAGASATSG
jgi:hypothetical protein